MTHYDGYIFKKNRTMITDADGNQWDFCEEIRIVAVLSDIRSKARRVRVRITLTSGEKVYVNVDRDRIASSPIPVLAKYGLTLASTHEYNVTVTEILFETQATAKQGFFHDALGWRTYQKELCFFGCEMLGVSASSTYLRPKKLRPSGSLEVWREGISAFITDRPELQLALAIGACAPIASLLQKADVLELVSVFALIGQSSTGKTSALKMMASIWGKPSIQDGIIDTLLDTQNRFFANLGKKRGFPCFIDETSVLDNDLSSMLYQLSLGKERGRCNPDGSAKKTNHWSGTIVFTGETSLFLQTNGNKGLFARLVECPFVWTKDGPSAEKMTQHCAQNYGTAYVPLINYLLELPIDNLIVMYQNAIDTLHEYLQVYTGVERRLMKQYALLLLTARIIRDVWDIPICEEAIIRLLLQTHAEHPMHSMPEVIFESVKEQVLAHQEKFPKKNSDGCEYHGIWGERDTYKFAPCVWIAANRFDEFVENAGTRNSKELLAQFHSNNWLAKFGDRYKKDHPLGGTDVKCYCLLLGSASAPKARSTLVSKRSQISSLLCDDIEETSSADTAG